MAPAFGVMVWLIGAIVASAAEGPLYEQEPYDLVTLTKTEGGDVLKVEPLDIPGRRVPEDPPSHEGLEMRLWEDPTELYTVRWGKIEKVELFEQLLLNEASRLIGRRKLAEAYAVYEFMLEEYPEAPGLDEAIENYLYEEAKALHVAQEYENALAVLLDLHERNPERSGLENALGLTTEKLVERHVATDNHGAAQRLLRNLAKLHPEHAVVAKWESDFKEEASRLLDQARQDAAKGDLRNAHAKGRRLKELWPNLPGAKEFLQSLHEDYCRTVVAVTVPAPSGDPSARDDWAARRSRRLLYRTIMEFAGPGIEGGTYVCPLGQMETQELGLRLAFELKTDLRWSEGDALLTGYDLSQRLLEIADPEQSVYRVEWAELLTGVSVEDVFSVNVDLRRPHVRPEALLQTSILPYSGMTRAKAAKLTNGPYVVDSRTDGETVFAANPQYFAAGPTQPKEIVERHFDQGAKAIWDLQYDRVDLIDRINPWDLGAVEEMEDLVVQPYGMPLVHCLVPNLDNPLLARRAFRRALVYGIHREVILDHLLGGKEQLGCRVLSGPFSPGITRDDPLGYAYDAWIKPRRYDPRLAIALSHITLQEMAAKEEAEVEKLTAIPNLVLGHPAHEIARRASQEIQRQLNLVGVPISLKEVPSGVGARIPKGVDLLYAELAVWEPVVDARRLLDHDGICGGASPYMTQALRELDLATDWMQVGVKLRQIHRLAHQEVAVIPLWQLTDHFAYRRALGGVGSRPATIYQNIENWQPAFYYPEEE